MILRMAPCTASLVWQIIWVDSALDTTRRPAEWVTNFTTSSLGLQIIVPSRKLNTCWQCEGTVIPRHIQTWHATLFAYLRFKVKRAQHEGPFGDS